MFPTTRYLISQVDEFTKFIHYTRKLEFEENPDYEYLKNLIFTIMSNNSHEFDNLYDWKNIKFREDTVSTNNTNTNQANISVNLDPNQNT